MSTGTRIGLVIISLSLLLSFSTPLYAADSVLTHPPVVTSITDPTNVVAGTSYIFTGVATSTSEYALSQVTLYATGVLTTTTNLATKNAGDSGCSTTSCTLTDTFVPDITDRITLFLVVTYSDGGSFYQCDSVVNSGKNDCQGSTDTTVVDGTTTTNDSLPSTGLLSNQTKGIYIGLGFIILGILTTQTSRLTNTFVLLNEKRITKRKTKFEKKF